MNDPIQALKSANAWLERWAVHVGNCRGGLACTCGLTLVRYEAERALLEIEYPTDDPDQ
jgi:hypothetical protein